MSEKKTVTVRIPVAVWSDGKWVSFANSSYLSAEERIQSLKEMYPTADRHTWITAEVPVPETTEVQGRVEG